MNTKTWSAYTFRLVERASTYWYDRTFRKLWFGASERTIVRGRPTMFSINQLLFTWMMKLLMFLYVIFGINCQCFSEYFFWFPIHNERREHAHTHTQAPRTLNWDRVCLVWTRWGSTGQTTMVVFVHYFLLTPKSCVFCAADFISMACDISSEVAQKVTLFLYW